MWTEAQSEQFLKKYVPVAKSTLCTTKQQALKVAKKYPVVLKISSTDIVHKTEFHGVRVVHSEKELREVYDQLMETARKKKAKDAAVLVQEYICGTEFIIGLQHDPTFGHVVMLGLGGIFVEVFEDVTFRACPISVQEAYKMMDDLQAKKLLAGARGIKLDKKSLAQAISNVSKIPQKHPDIKSLDINPYILHNTAGKVVDARIEWA